MDKQEEKNTQQLVFFSYIDKETGKVLAQDQASGKTGELISYQPDQRLAALGQQGSSWPIMVFQLMPVTRRMTR